MQRLRAVGPRLITLILAVFILIAASVPSADAYQRRRRHNPEAGKGKAAKRIGIGAAIGAGAGGLIGGRKGAVIGAGAGAAGGGIYHVHKKRSWRRHHRRG
jgi:uncharacterized membrane protein